MIILRLFSALSTTGARVRGQNTPLASRAGDHPTPDAIGRWSAHSCYHRTMFGSHLSIAGSLANAVNEARRLKMDCVQVFTKNQRQWKVSPLRGEQITEWAEALAAADWLASPVARVVSHNSYLINMASPDEAMREKSIALQRIEIERCEQLHIPLCVAHPGAHLGEAPPTGTRLKLTAEFSSDEVAGLKRIIAALDRIHKELPGYKTLTCLETTVGSGSNLGYSFHQLAYIRERVKQPERIAYCFDTCHVTAAGYDMTSDEKAEAVLESFDEICGFENLRVFHLNDSVGTVGSRRDRHAHIGEGRCGRSCFRAIVNHPAFGNVPKILETPKESTDKGTPWDVVNIRRLKRMQVAAASR